MTFTNVIKSLLIGIFFVSFAAMAEKPAMWGGTDDTPECQKCIKDYTACVSRVIKYAPDDDIDHEIMDCRFTKIQCLSKNECRNKE